MTDSRVITQEVWLRHWCECNAHPSLSRFYSRNARARLDKCVYRASNSVRTRGSRGDEKKTRERSGTGEGKRYGGHTEGRATCVLLLCPVRRIQPRNTKISIDFHEYTLPRTLVPSPLWNIKPLNYVTEGNFFRGIASVGNLPRATIGLQCAA